MKLLKIMAIAASAMFASANAFAGVAGVVFSNIGPSATDLTKLGTGTSSNLANNSIRAGGFKTGGTTGSTWTVNWFRGGFFQVAPPTGVATRVEIFASDGTNPTGTALFTSDPTNVTDSVPGGTPTEYYTFNFNGVNGITLAANTNYYLIPKVADSAGSFAWYLNEAGDFADQVASSGWSWTNGRRSLDGGSTWSPNNQAFTMAFSGTLNQSAVPEPALTSLLCLGGVALIRRRMKK